MNTDVVIIGGGIQGCATAYFLARQGVDVILIEKNHIARHASGVNAGGVRLLGRDIAEVPLSKAAMALWPTLNEMLGHDTGFQTRSLINIAADEADMEILQKRQEIMHAQHHFHEQLIDQQELRERLPAVANHCVGGVISVDDGYAIPYKTTTAFYRAARTLGAGCLHGETVNNIRKVGKTWIVSTQNRSIECQHLVNCAGAWADQIAQYTGDNIPLVYSAPMLMITSRMPHFATPVIGAVSRALSFKQFDNGTVLIGGGAKGFADRDSNQTRLDYSKLSVGAQNTIHFFPIMRSASINRMWAGLEAYLPDNLPVIGQSAKTENAYHAFGFSAHGFQMGPIVGQVMADLITKRTSHFDLSPFRIDRFERKVL